jgi:hypothetical protein
LKYVLRQLLFTRRHLAALLQQTFPGSEWAPTIGETPPGPDSSHPGSIRPLPASTLSGYQTDALPSGGAGADTTRPLSYGEFAKADSGILQVCHNATRPLALIGGAKYDEEPLGRFLRSLPPDTIIVTGDGRGSEKRSREIADELGLRVDVPALRPEIYGAKALEVQVSDILIASSGDVTLIGEGGRPALAKGWLKRAKWGRKANPL